jgi:hypothetical protein
MRRLSLLLLSSIAAWGVGCGDTTSRPTSDGGSPGDAKKTDGQPSSGFTWTKTPLDTHWAGTHASIGHKGNVLGIAYYRKVEQDVITHCPASGTTGASDKPKPAHDLYYLQFDGTNWGTPVKVDQNIGSLPQGLSLVMDQKSGTTYIGYLGGAVGEVSCDSSDAMIASSTDGTTWNKQTLNSAGPFAGDTVGYWTSVALDSKGAVHAAYQDVRFTFYEHDGEYKASLLYDGGEVVAAQNAAGVYNSLLFDAQDHPVVATFKKGSNHEILLSAKIGSTWQAQQLRAGDTDERISLGTDGKGLFGLAFYDQAKQALSYVESAQGLKSWKETTVDPELTNNGKYASLAFDSKGNPGISYYTCGLYGTEGKDKCEFGKDALRFAYRQKGDWTTYTVDDGGANRCGTYTSLTFGAEDEPIIAYQCVGLTAGSQFVDNLKVAIGRAQ